MASPGGPSTGHRDSAARGRQECPPHRSVVLLTLLTLAVSHASPCPGGPAAKHLKQPDDWFRGDDGRRVTDNVLSHQSDRGDWPKNTDTAAPYAGDRAGLRGTFDNGATTDELRFLARAYNATNDERCRVAFLKGLDHVLDAQYPTGGWPQSHPPGDKYPRHITFNDDAMVRLMELLREVRRSDGYAFIDDDRRAAAGAAFDRGVACILKCQIEVGGEPTAWCAQHDEKDYRPRPGRKYELASLSGHESVNLVRLLMSLDEPSPEAVRAIEGAVAWFEAVKLTGVRVEKKADRDAPGGFDTVVVEDPAAPPLWARFYEIGTNRPLFADRDGVAKYGLAEIGHERRNHYTWYVERPRKLLEKEFPAWKAKHPGDVDGRTGE